MKRLNFVVMLMMSLVVISCSKEDERPLVNITTSIELDVSSIGYPYEIIEEEGKLKCYVIDIPCEETIVNVEFAKIKFASLWELQTGVYDKYSSRYIWHNRICPDSTIGLEYLGDYYWKFESVFGDYSITEDYVLKCHIPEHKESSIKATKLALSYSSLQGCSIIFRQTPNL